MSPTSFSISIIGPSFRGGPDMRLPADATLIVLPGGEGAIDLADFGANLVRLLEAWRAEDLPIVHVGRNGPGGVAALEGETVIIAIAASAFEGTSLEGLLEEIGATTLTLCGGAEAVEATACDADRLGYQTFVVADACGSSSAAGGAALTHLHGKSATIVDTETTLRAAAIAKARQRRGAMRSK